MKPKKCKNCTQLFDPQRPLQQTCNYKCAIELSQKQRAETEKKNWRVKKAKVKESLKTITQYEKEARKVFQRWIRERDRDQPCISCGTTTAKQWDGGHYLKAELFSGAIFHEFNCHKQCSQCNDLYSGNELNYRDGLIKRYGKIIVESFELKKDSYRNYKYSKEQLIQIKNNYSDKIKKMVFDKSFEEF